MLSAKEFAARWGQDEAPLQRFPKRAVAALPIPEEDKEFLLGAGLPEEAAPFLCFDIPTSGALPTVAQAWDQPAAFRRYRVLGSDDSGNPIAIDEQGGEVVCLDHERRFARVLMNTSIRQLAESLLAYRKMVEDTTSQNGEEAFLDGNVPVECRKALKKALTDIDGAAVQTRVLHLLSDSGGR